MAKRYTVTVSIYQIKSTNFLDQRKDLTINVIVCYLTDCKVSEKAKLLLQLTTAENVNRLDV